MFCPKCGQENSSAANHCVRCGEGMPNAEPQYGVVVPASSARVAVNNNLVWAILATLFCCLPFGIVAIVYAAQVDAKVSAGDIAGAQLSARHAGMWSWISFGVFMAVIVVYFAIVIAAAQFAH